MFVYWLTILYTYPGFVIVCQWSAFVILFGVVALAAEVDAWNQETVFGMATTPDGGDILRLSQNEKSKIELQIAYRVVPDKILLPNTDKMSVTQW